MPKNYKRSNQQLLQKNKCQTRCNIGLKIENNHNYNLTNYHTNQRRQIKVQFKKWKYVHILLLKKETKKQQN